MVDSVDIFSATSLEFQKYLCNKTNKKGGIQIVDLYQAIMKKGIGIDSRKCDVSGKIEVFFNKDAIFPHIPSFSNALALQKIVYKTLEAETSFLPSITCITDINATKVLFQTHDGYDIESVIIPMQHKNTLCISSQIGCKMGCVFCETGRMGLIRNLTVSEIVQQVFLVKHVLKQPIHNIVFMGMGEPFDNYEAVLHAVSIFSDMKGLGFGLKNITISTSGRVQEIRKLIGEKTRPTPNLAVSINAANEALRTRLMPHNRKESLHELMEAIQEYIIVKGKEVLLAYVLIQHVNDSQECALELARLVGPLHSHIKINLIPYNPQSCDKFQPPQQDVIDRFAVLLRSHKIQVLLRTTKGRSIMAGCGQLGNLDIRNRKKQSYAPSVGTLSFPQEK